jgi:alkanesulfonate monooxygenase SsuD/methylene tetrahydromethanopterin reductase-like flavin-dependent oxidoreductase (luciferase family)
MDEFPKQLPVSSRGEWYQGWPLIPWLAAKTQKVRIGMSITDTPYRAPGVLAAELATVDHLSNGRLNVGVGAGWMPEEFAAASASHIFPKRHKHVRETIEIMQGIWTNDLFEYHGEFADFDRCGFGAKPSRSPTRRSTSAGSRTRSAPPTGSRSTTWRAGSASRTRPTRCSSGGCHRTRAGGAGEVDRRHRALEHDLVRHHRPGHGPDAGR